MGKGKIIGSLMAGKDESGEGDEGRERETFISILISFVL